ncbi:hypothetical protein L596_005781 [Steinernema carpocapsae]|uniref:Uncharacterized protein n=1 Tax=Steinernema carpocapsae TaxID=34508 RepID=A0A4U8V040_STECR|nr:hypothetical protein L596_005781 [Steinernema carpocapsae]
MAALATALLRRFSNDHGHNGRENSAVFNSPKTSSASTSSSQGGVSAASTSTPRRRNLFSGIYYQSRRRFSLPTFTFAHPNRNSTEPNLSAIDENGKKRSSTGSWPDLIEKCDGSSKNRNAEVADRPGQDKAHFTGHKGKYRTASGARQGRLNKMTLAHLNVLSAARLVFTQFINDASF